MEEIKLWEKDIPLLQDGLKEPVFMRFKAEKKLTDATVLICPGGGYRFMSFPSEGQEYAEFFNALGMDVFVLKYRIYPYKYPTQLLDARRAIRYIRANAETLGINPDKILIMGSSAGGHLASTCSTYMDKIDGEGVDELDNVCPRPNGQILCYPVTDVASHYGTYKNGYGENFDETKVVSPTDYVDENTPMAFLWHTATDETVSVMGSYRFTQKLIEHKLPVEMHIFPIGRHGLGLADREDREVPHLTQWHGLLTNWLKLNNFL